MRRPKTLLVSSACALVMLAFVWARPHQRLWYKDEGVEIEGRRCPFLSTLSPAFRCGWLIAGTAPSERVALAVVRLSDANGPRAGTLVLDGGPGQPSLLGADTYSYWSEWGTRLGFVGDLVVFDYRGTGESRPQLGCGSQRPTLAAGWDEPPNIAREIEELISALHECAAHAVSVGQKLEHLSTERNAQDAIAILTALEYESWNLYAVSYGTTVAQRLLDGDAPQVSKVILDSPPLLRRSVELTVLAWANTPGLLDMLCDHLGECDERNSLDLRRALSRLRREPHRFNSANIRAQLIVDDYRFLQTIVDALGKRHTRRQLPWIIGAAAEGDYRGLETLVEVFLETEGTLNSNDLVFWTTECNDFGALDLGAFQQLLREHPFARPYIPEVGCPLDLNAGSQLVVAGAAQDAADVLVLSARFDPVSTVVAAREVAARFGATVAVFDEASHGVAFDNDPCVVAVVAEFNRHRRLAGERGGVCAGSVQLFEHQRP